MKNKDIKTILMPVILCSLLIFTSFALMINVLNENMIPDSNYNTNLNLKQSGKVNITIFEDDFESGLSKWSENTGLWHMTDSLSNNSNPYNSYEHAMWYGQNSTGNYDTGARTRGNLTSVPFDLTTFNEAYLEFYHWRSCEPTYDISYVNISIDGNSWVSIYEIAVDISPWEKKVLNISSYCGNSSVQIMFYFDTYDDRTNAYSGWIVDDIKVTSWEDDTIDPVLINPPSDFAVEIGYTGQSISWTATDANPYNYTIKLGSDLKEGPLPWLNNTPVIFDIPDGFIVGDYIYTINFTDLGTNDITDSVTFTVEDTTSPVITNAPGNFSVDFGYTEQTLSWTATDSNPYNYTIKLGSDIKAGPTNWTSGEAIIYNITDGFALGNYEYMINLTDDQGNFITDNATFTVEVPTPPNIIDAPSDFVVEYGYTGQSLSWTATDNHPINYTIELQGTGLVAGPAPWISGNAITYNILNGYAVGDYIYIVNFTDDKGNYTTDSVTFSVQDATDPIITVAPSDLTLAYDYTGESLSWTATDPHPNTYIIELQGTGIVVPTTWISGNAITYNIPDGLAPGVYVYNITLTDLYGNSFSDSVSVTVEEKPSGTNDIPLGNFYLLFIAIGIIAIIIKIKRKK